MPGQTTKQSISKILDGFGLDENGDGYILTAPLMDWFWDHYIDKADRNDPRVAPL